jgi:hypothetical protein
MRIATPGQDLGVRRGDVLHPRVGVLDLGTTPPADRAPKGRRGEPLVEAAAQVPAPDAASQHVPEEYQIDEFLQEPEVGMSATQAFRGDALPAGDKFGFPLGLPGHFGRAVQASEDFVDDLGLELRREGSASAFGHWRTLLDGQF